MNRPLIEMPDINVLVGMFDENHPHHEISQNWFLRASLTGWALCPLTISGFLRVISRPSYSPVTTMSAASDYLNTLIDEHHVTYHYWLDEISLINNSLFDISRLRGYRQLTDLHLLGIAHRNGGTFVTFDGGLSDTFTAVRNPSPQLLRISTP